MKVAVGSKNPVKFLAVKQAFRKVFPEEKIEWATFKADSQVPDQPFNEETIQGAKNRARHARAEHKADFGVGLEGGILEMDNKGFICGFVAVDWESGHGVGLCPGFQCPPRVLEELKRGGTELGKVIDRYTGEHNTKEKEGSVGFFTNGAITRKDLFYQATILALIPFKRQDLF